MSTHADVVVKTGPRLYRVIYVHMDGYPSYLGKMLLDHYASLERANALVDLGNLSVVRPNLGEKHNGHPFDAVNDCEKARDLGWCVSFGRDRGEDPAENAAEEVISTEPPPARSEVSYHYVFDGEEWWFASRGQPLKPLSHWAIAQSQR